MVFMAHVRDVSGVHGSCTEELIMNIVRDSH